VKVEQTPKCHPKIAGEGIEYDWGCGKGVYHRLPLSQKRTKEKFWESVKECLDSDKVLPFDCRHIFSKCAREYMLAYNILDNSKETGSAAGVDDEKKHMMAYLI
jgi:hypothetical protein